MLPILQVGPAAIQVEGLVLLFGLWVGLTLSEKFCDRRGITSTQLYNLVFFMMIGGLIGARLSFVLRYPEAFIKNPISIISLNPGLLDFWGGLLVAVLVGLAYTQRRQIPILSALDALNPLLAVLMIAVPLSHLASGEAYGKPASIPWGIYLWGMQRHPTQIYGALAGILVLVLLWPARQSFDQKQPGEYFFLFMSLTAASALFLEFFRGDSLLILGGIRSKQVAAWGILVSCLWILNNIRNSRHPEMQNNSLQDRG
ncbi:MAG: hypothetical protein A2Z16_16830 [Chloroflexi bacterium RBG_16_54_18]|nr:MAG: hypothetical protein A2Z16_16830 [Chloroflexi bacterium RBG_16_54_18]